MIVILVEFPFAVKEKQTGIQGGKRIERAGETGQAKGHGGMNLQGMEQGEDHLSTMIYLSFIRPIRVIRVQIFLY